MKCNCTGLHLSQNICKMAATAACNFATKSCMSDDGSLQTSSFRCPQIKKSRQFSSSGLTGHNTRLLCQTHLPGKRVSQRDWAHAPSCWNHTPQQTARNISSSNNDKTSTTKGHWEKGGASMAQSHYNQQYRTIYNYPSKPDGSSCVCYMGTHVPTSGNCDH